MPIESPAIAVHDLNFAYNGHPVLEHVTFTVERGDYVGIIGPNGGGKTTLLKILVGLLPAPVDSVKIFGVPLASFKAKYKIGYVPQRIAQDSVAFPATVYEVVASGLLSKTLGHKDILTALDLAQIGDLKNKLMSRLSGGQKQRVYVARALVSNPELLLLDEPFIGIDAAAQHDFYAFLKKLNQEQHLTILFVSHDIDVVSEEVKSILCLNRGLLCFGSPTLLHQAHTLEELYGKKITHIHHA